MAKTFPYGSNPSQPLKSNYYENEKGMQRGMGNAKPQTAYQPMPSGAAKRQYVQSGINPLNAYVPQKQNMFGNNFAVESDRGYQPLGDYNMNDSDGDFNWFGEDGVLEPGAKALFGGLGAIMNYQQLGLNKDAAKFKKGMDRTNLFNQAKTSNFNLTQHAEDEAIGQGLTGDAKAAYVSNQVKRHGVKGSF